MQKSPSRTSLVATSGNEKPRQYGMLIGGEWLQARSGKTFESLNPFTGRAWAVVPEAGPEDVDAAVAAAQDALTGPWGQMSGIERARLMRRLATTIADHAEELAVFETTDNGKLIREMKGQVASLTDWYNYFAGAADKLQGETIPSARSDYLIYTKREPVGVVVGIIPWNSPLLLLTWKLAAALAAGCTFIAKPAEQTPVSTLEFGRLFAEAGFPPGVFNVLTGFGEVAGRALVRHPGINKVAFTGSTETGIRVMKDAAEHVTRVSLELGGKSPNIVFADADLSAATNGVLAGIFAATGQTCVAGSRLLVERSVHDELVARVVERARAIRLGDPLQMETEMGPVAFKEQFDKVRSYIDLGQSEGATLAYGGGSPSNPELKGAYFIEPTVLTHVGNKMRVAQEEIFGPVLCVIPFDDEREAVELANDTRYGLAAGIWTKDIYRAHRVAGQIKAGSVWVNAYRAISFNAPFGGYGMSGIGRENGLDAVREYTQVKTVWVELTGKERDPFKLG
jgi:aldehyde dehydrogenase (NAD+)